MTTVASLTNTLQTLSRGNAEYARFNARIVNTKLPVLGVRAPDARRLAKQLARHLTSEDVTRLLMAPQPSFDYILTCGLIITELKARDEQLIRLTRQFLPLTDSWAHIDTFVCKRPRFASDVWWHFALECLESRQEFTVRYGIISLMSNFLDEAHIATVLPRLRRVRHDGLYVKLALAWTYATAAVSYFDIVLAELDNPEITPWVRAKSYQKMRESRRFTAQQQMIIKQRKESS